MQIIQGASANGLREEVLTLKVARYCQQELSQYSGVRVVMIREMKVVLTTQHQAIA